MTQLRKTASVTVSNNRRTSHTTGLSRDGR